MPELVLPDGIDPEDPERVVLAVVVDPEGSLGERAVMAVGDYCFPDEEANVAHILQTDAFIECALEADEVLVYTTPLDRLTEEDCPLIFAPPAGPDRGRVHGRAHHRALA
jgi:hypothetical protein